MHLTTQFSIYYIKIMKLKVNLKPLEKGFLSFYQPMLYFISLGTTTTKKFLSSREVPKIPIDLKGPEVRRMWTGFQAKLILSIPLQLHFWSFCFLARKMKIQWLCFKEKLPKLSVFFLKKYWLKILSKLLKSGSKY